MKNYKKYTYQLKTLSTLVLSPREGEGFYLAAEDFSAEDVGRHSHLAKENIKIIYPFYQYGAYERYDPEQAQYYIPGSSIKGAIRSRKDKADVRMMVDDVRVESGMLCLRNLYKAQHIPPLDSSKRASGKQMKLEKFFPNVAVEMLEAGDAETECKGNLYCESDPREYLREAQGNTARKLGEFCETINNILENIGDSDGKRELEEVRDKIKQLKDQTQYHDENTFLLLLGGYKGLILSSGFSCKDTPGAIYLDKENKLPHGLIRMKLDANAVC